MRISFVMRTFESEDIRAASHRGPAAAVLARPARPAAASRGDAGGAGLDRDRGRCSGGPTRSRSASSRSSTSRRSTSGRRRASSPAASIELTMESGQGGAAIVPGVVSGQFQFGFSNITSLLIAQTKNVPIKAVANGVASTGEAGERLRRAWWSRGQPDQDGRRPGRQEGRGEHAEEHRRHHGARVGPQGRRRPGRDQLRRDAVPRHAGRAGRRPGRRGLGGRAVPCRDLRPARAGGGLRPYVDAAPRPDRRRVLHLDQADRRRRPTWSSGSPRR